MAQQNMWYKVSVTFSVNAHKFLLLDIKPSYDMFRLSKRPSSANSKELSHKDTQLKYTTGEISSLHCIKNIFSQYSTTECIKRGK